jgi:hypothetical protein
VVEEDPANYREAMKCAKKEKWIEATVEEVKQLRASGTWELVDLPAGRKAIGNRWVFKLKKDAGGIEVRFKARLVSQGFRRCLGSITARVQRGL